MAFQIRIQQWVPPNLPNADKYKLARQVEQAGADAVARDMRPWNVSVLIAGVVIFVVGLALVTVFSAKPSMALLLSAVLALCGFFLVPIAIYTEVRNRANCVAWLSEIQQYYGKNRAQFGN